MAILSIKKFNVYLADLGISFGVEPGKKRPVVVIQTNMLNDIGHPSTLVCPITSKLIPDSTILHIRIPKGNAGLEKESEIVVDQIKAIDNSRIIKRLGVIGAIYQQKLLESINILLLK